MRLKKACRFPGCPELTHKRFCPTHRPITWQDDRRGTSRERGYTRAWDKVAQLRRQLDAGLCQPCLRDDRLTMARTVDHIVPLHVRPDWKLVLENTQVICALCHARKTAADTSRYGSSTQTKLSAEQRANVERARALEVAPRCGEEDDVR
jgi:5-methylcytosine-specific restriction protein A